MLSTCKLELPLILHYPVSDLRSTSNQIFDSDDDLEGYMIAGYMDIDPLQGAKSSFGPERKRRENPGSMFIVASYPSICIVT